MKKMIQKVPIPLCGVMLGFAALGNLLQSYGEGIRYVCGGIATFLLILVLMKLIMFPEMIKEDFKNPILASVAATFPMALMLLSTYIKPFIGVGAKYIWYFCDWVTYYIDCLFHNKFLLKLQMPKYLPVILLYMWELQLRQLRLQLLKSLQ